MNKGTEGLKQVLTILDNMSVEEYEKLYDEMCEQYSDDEFFCVLADSLDMHSLSTQMYNANSDIKTLSSVTSMSDICGYVSKNDETIENITLQPDDTAILTNIKQLFFNNMNVVNDCFSQHGNKVKFYASR